MNSKLMEAEFAYTFDDFTLVPQMSEIRSRKDPETSITPPGFNRSLSVPIIASPMNTITEKEMISAMCEVGASAILHRYMSFKDQVKICKELSSIKHCWDEDGKSMFWVAIGASGDFLERAGKLSKQYKVNKICIDVANGHSTSCIEAVKKVKKLVGDKAHIMAGNVCSYDGALNLAAAGANSIRVGVGTGSICSTRVVTGHGVPQLTALEECRKIKQIYPEVLIIADGGFRHAGDMVKAHAIGSDLSITGSLLAGTPETPGEIIEENGKIFKMYAGMSSEMGRESWFGHEKSNYVPEGVSFKVPYIEESVQTIVKQLNGGIKVGMSYAGAQNMEELRQKAVWKRITNAGHIEGTPHGKRS